MTPVSYGIWERCEYTNLTLMRQGVTLGTRTNVQFCHPNRYMRYSTNNYTLCHNYRRKCSVFNQDQFPEGCSCQYLPSTKGLQWLTGLAAICLILGILLLYLRSIASPNNSSYTIQILFELFLFCLFSR